jgi:hypothetical protein
MLIGLGILVFFTCYRIVFDKVIAPRYQKQIEALEAEMEQEVARPPASLAGTETRGAPTAGMPF